jgi:hypothetical protein
LLYIDFRDFSKDPIYFIFSFGRKKNLILLFWILGSFRAPKTSRSTWHV